MHATFVLDNVGQIGKICTADIILSGSNASVFTGDGLRQDMGVKDE